MATSRPRAVVVGAGLGGLFSAAMLAADGFEVEVYEKLLFFGGKFTSFDCDGFQIPTGALHTLPGGRHGPIAKACAELGVPLKLHHAKPGFVVRRGDQRYAVSKNPFKPGTFLELMPWLDKFKIGLAIGGFAVAPLLPETSLERWLSIWGVPPDLQALLDRTAQFSLGVPMAQASARDVGCSLWQQRWRTEAVVRGGVKSVADGLAQAIRDRGGRLHKGRETEAILVGPDRAEGIQLAGGEVVEADRVVCCVGAPRSATLLGEHCPDALRALVRRARPAFGATYSVRSRRPLAPSPAIELPLDSAHISGYVQVSLAAPELAPRGWHYLLAYQVLNETEPIDAQLAAGRLELVSWFDGLSDEAIFHTSVYRRDWPAARLGQSVGQTGPRRCPIQFASLPGLYFVSHDSVGHGIAAEIIPGAARRMCELVRSRRDD